MSEKRIAEDSNPGKSLYDEKYPEKGTELSGRSYWAEAASCFGNIRILTFAAVIIALRVAVKFIRIPLAADLSLTFDCYVNALGSLVYGPLVALAVGAVSDTLGCIIAPSGPYFFPFILVEMSSGFIFSLFLWKRKITVSKVLWSKFTVNLFCNILLNSLLMKWYYSWLYGGEKVYNLINMVRIVKNLIIFPLEASLICLLFEALMPALASYGLVSKENRHTRYDKNHLWIQISISLALSVLAVLLYIFVFKDLISANNIKFL